MKSKIEDVEDEKKNLEDVKNMAKEVFVSTNITGFIIRVLVLIDILA